MASRKRSSRRIVEVFCRGSWAIVSLCFFSVLGVGSFIVLFSALHGETIESESFLSRLGLGSALSFARRTGEGADLLADSAEAVPFNGVATPDRPANRRSGAAAAGPASSSERSRVPPAKARSAHFQVRLSHDAACSAGAQSHDIRFSEASEANCKNCFDTCGKPSSGWQYIQVECDVGHCAAVLFGNCVGTWHYPDPHFVSVVLVNDGCMRIPANVAHIRLQRIEPRGVDTTSGRSEVTHDYEQVLRRLFYWQTSGVPGAALPATDRYVTFNTDCGGFNNIRMGFEHAVLLAWATGRTLVLPPPRAWYLIDNGPITRKGAKPGQSDYSDFWSIDDLRRAIPVISRAEFEQRLGSTKPDTARLPWDPHKYAILWPSAEAVRSAKDYSQKNKEMIGTRATKVLTPAELAKQVLHFPACEPPERPRFLNQVSGVIIYADRKDDVARNRFFRQSVHYADEIYRQAAHVIAILGLFNYTSLHIRRNDLQYKESHISAEATLANIEALVPEGAPLYVATDEMGADFFAALHRRHPVYRWHDFDRPGGIFEKSGVTLNRKVIGQIEQVICAAGSRFFGTQHSTFTSHIFRLRGYIGAPDTTMRWHTLRHTGDVELDKIHTPTITGNSYMVEDPALWTDL